MGVGRCFVMGGSSNNYMGLKGQIIIGRFFPPDAYSTLAITL
jgi:hypothetical protein